MEKENNIKLCAKLITLSIISTNDWYNLADFLERVDNKSLEFGWLNSLISLSKTSVYKEAKEYLEQLKLAQKALITQDREIKQENFAITQRYKFTDNILDLKDDKESFVLDYTLPIKNNFDLNPFLGKIFINFPTNWLNEIKNLNKEDSFKIIENLLYDELKRKNSAFKICFKPKNELSFEINKYNIDDLNSEIVSISNKVISYIYSDIFYINEIVKTKSYFYYEKLRRFIPEVLKHTDTNFFNTPNELHLEYLNKKLIIEKLTNK